MHSHFDFSRPKRGLLSLVTLTLVALTAAALSASASAAPAVTLTHDYDLGANPTVEVDGTGFTPPTPVLNPGQGKIGLYVAQTAIVDGEVVVGEAQQWIRPLTFGGSGNTLLNDDGTFSTELEVDQVIGAGPEALDCAEVQCYISTWQAHGNPVAQELFTQSPIYFVPSATVTPTANLPETQQVTVSGRGYNPGAPGVYVSQVARVGDSLVTPPPGGGTTMQWVRPAGSPVSPALSADGSFETSVTVSRTFKDAAGATVDCSVVECSVITWRAHTNPSPATVYTSAPLSFSPPVKPDPTPNPTPTPLPVEVRPSATVSKKKEFQLGTKARKLNFVTVTCGTAACQFQKPKRVAVKVGKGKLWLTVTGPKRAAAGQGAKFGVRVSGKAAKRLAGHKARVKFKIRTSSDAGQRTVNVNKLLVGASK